MTIPVKRDPGDLRTARRRDTERRIIDAATALFLRDGYASTSLAAVADTAGVGERTLYLRFGTKAGLLKRAIDVAIVGDTEPVDLAHRDTSLSALTAPTLADRLRAVAAMARQTLERSAGLIEVAQQAAGEPVIADQAQAGREATSAFGRRFWQHLRDDGLISDDVDLDWVIATTGLLAHAETYILMTRTLRWTPAEYEDWVYRTWRHFATGPSRTP